MWGKFEWQFKQRDESRMKISPGETKNARETGAFRIRQRVIDRAC
jgi:hypothetical protein